LRLCLFLVSFFRRTSLPPALALMVGLVLSPVLLSLPWFFFPWGAPGEGWTTNSSVRA